jgi:hypothetical protein
MAAAPMNRKALEVQEDLYPVLRKLNPCYQRREFDSKAAA